jgi:hypothetical protein
VLACAPVCTPGRPGGLEVPSSNLGAPIGPKAPQPPGFRASRDRKRTHPRMEDRAPLGRRVRQGPDGASRSRGVPTPVAAARAPLDTRGRFARSGRRAVSGVAPNAFDLASNLYQCLLHAKRQCLHFKPKNLRGVVLANRLLDGFGGLPVPVEASSTRVTRSAISSCLLTMSRSVAFGDPWATPCSPQRRSAS